jgi:histone deacetylase 11
VFACSAQVQTMRSQNAKWIVEMKWNLAWSFYSILLGVSLSTVHPISAMHTATLGSALCRTGASLTTVLGGTCLGFIASNLMHLATSKNPDKGNLKSQCIVHGAFGAVMCGAGYLITPSTSLFMKVLSVVVAYWTAISGHQLWSEKRTSPPACTPPWDLTKIPVVFHPNYDIGFFGLEKAHPFDSKKYGKVYQYLCKTLGLTRKDFYEPARISDEALKTVMTNEYLNCLDSSPVVTDITGVLPLAVLPNILVRRYLLDAMRYATDGTIKATQLALDSKNRYKCAINLSGGYHHACGNGGGGFCVFPDIQLACKKAWEQKPDLKILYVDLDAHQGNGVELTLEKEMGAGRFTVFDVYGQNNYPYDEDSRRIRDKIKYGIPLPISCTDRRTIDDRIYMERVTETLPTAIRECKPELIFYNAGTDVYEKDRLGGMKLTKDGIKRRDAFVFKQAQENNIPIVMTLSGGYSPDSTQIIGESIKDILNLHVMEIRSGAGLINFTT